MAKLTVPIRVDALEEAKAHAKEYYDKGYQQGRADREEEVLNYLVDNGYIRYGFDAEYLAEQLESQNAL